jgi:TolA-binding protein
MNNDASYYNQIDAFLAGKLSASEREAMQRAISENADLAMEVELRKLEFDVSESLIANDIRAQMARLRSASSPNAPTEKTEKKRTNWYILSAVILLLIGLVWWRILPPSIPKQDTSPAQPAIPDSASNKAPTRNDIATKDTLRNAVPPPAFNTKPTQTQPDKRLAMAEKQYRDPDFESLRSVGKTASGLEKALDAWQQKNYRLVISESEKIEKTSPQYAKARYLMAHACFKSGKFKRAATLFAAVADGRVRPFSEEAEWYVIPAMLADPALDRSLLQKRIDFILKDPQHPYFEHCKTLNQQLKQ